MLGYFEAGFYLNTLITLLPPKSWWRWCVSKCSKWNEIQIKIAKHCLILSNWTCHETIVYSHMEYWNSRQWFSFVVKQGLLLRNWQFGQYTVTGKTMCIHENNTRDYWDNVHSLFSCTFQYPPCSLVCSHSSLSVYNRLLARQHVK